MSELDMGFDPTLTKKKKKKKTLDLDLEDTTTATEAVAGALEEEAAVDAELDLGSLSLKKKKSKKTAEQAEGGGADDGFGGDDFEFELPKKKKKKKKFAQVVEGEEDLAEVTPLAVESEQAEAPEELSGQGETMEEEPDLNYKELLDRVYETLKARNPDFVAGEKKKFVMKPPEVVRISARKTAFANFTDIVKLMHRQQDHVLSFMLAELGTTGTLDGNNKLVVKGRFQQKQIENVLRRYIREYVTCHTCRSPNTILTKEDRLFYLTCETCNARCTVAAIKSGFVAFTGKRSAVRRAAGN